MLQLISKFCYPLKISIIDFSLAFICLCIITTIFSMLYLNTNTQNSINNLNTYGNSVNLNVEQSYDLQKTSFIFNPNSINNPVKKAIPVSNLNYFIE